MLVTLYEPWAYIWSFAVSFLKKNQLQHTTHLDNYFKLTFFCEINQPLSIFIGKSTKFEFCDMNLTTLKVEPRSNDET